MSPLHLEPDVTTIRLRPYAPVLGGAVTFAGNSPYLEHVWLPILGPSAFVTYRRLLHLICTTEPPIDIDIAALGDLVGLQKRSLICRSLERLANFGFLHVDTDEVPVVVLVHTTVRALHRSRLRRVPLEVQRSHERLARAPFFLAQLPQDLVSYLALRTQLPPCRAAVTATRCTWCGPR